MPTSLFLTLEGELSLEGNVLHSGKLSRIGRKGAFRRENFRGMLTHIDGCGMPKILWRKFLQVAIKSWNSWRFSPSKVSRYTIGNNGNNIIGNVGNCGIVSIVGIVSNNGHYTYNTIITIITYNTIITYITLYN